MIIYCLYKQFQKNLNTWICLYYITSTIKNQLGPYVKFILLLLFFYSFIAYDNIFSVILKEKVMYLKSYIPLIEILSTNLKNIFNMTLYYL